MRLSHELSFITKAVYSSDILFQCFQVSMFSGSGTILPLFITVPIQLDSICQNYDVINEPDASPLFGS